MKKSYGLFLLLTVLCIFLFPVVASAQQSEPIYQDYSRSQSAYGESVALLNRSLAEKPSDSKTGEGYTAVLCRSDGTKPDFGPWAPEYVVAGPHDCFVDETETDEEYFEEKKRVDNVMDVLLDHKRIRKDSDLMVKVKDTLRDVKDARANTEMTDKKRRQVYRDAIDACKAYMEDRNPSTNIGKERLAMVGDVLSQLRAEIHRINNSMPN